MPRCTKCFSHDTAVKDSRTGMKDDVFIIRRRRLCLDCGYRFWTFEFPEEFVGDIGSTDSAKLEKVSCLIKQLQAAVR